VLKRQDVRDRSSRAASRSSARVPRTFRKFRQSDFEKWGRIVKTANIKFEP
jgi:hypothetical protein